MSASSDWTKSFKNGAEVVVSTCSLEGSPNSNIVNSLGIIDGQLLIANCQMKTTINNLRSNSRVCVVGGHVRIKGVATIQNSGKYFDFCKDNSGGYDVHDAILIKIDDVFDLDEVKPVEFA
jgi:hypothetical protein